MSSGAHPFTCGWPLFLKNPMFQLLVFDGWRRACGCYPFLACTRRLCLSEREGSAEAALNIDWQFNDNLFDDKPDLTPIAAMSAFTRGLDL